MIGSKDTKNKKAENIDTPNVNVTADNIEIDKE